MKTLNIKNHALMVKHEKLNEQASQKLLEQYNISKKQLPLIFKNDPALEGLDIEVGDVVEITRKSPTVNSSKFYRLVVNGWRIQNGFERLF